MQNYQQAIESRGLAILLEQLVRAAYEERGPKVVQPAQWQTLRYFVRATADARTVTRLAGFLQITKGPASRSIDALTRRGFLSSAKNPQDGRSSIYTLTKAGVKALENDPIYRLAHAIDGLDPSLQSDLERALLDLTDALKPESNEART